MTRQPTRDERVAGSWLLACGVFSLFTTGVAIGLIAFGGSGMWYLFLWPLIPAPILFVPYAFFKRKHPEHLRRFAAALGFVSAGVWTVIAVVVSAAFVLVAMLGEEKGRPLMAIGAVLLPVASWPAALWSAWVGYLSLRFLKV
ncbi:hypothetical protein [Mesorhizobium metallidurans]|uniref:hypothetical protein n=1 Tax=Mesorhizobium metallidurans TaxID=489722 RepID=UPI0012F85E57|nr:hypothetical protein [Mesorhizobium metallidurans]